MPKGEDAPKYVNVIQVKRLIHAKERNGKPVRIESGFIENLDCMVEQLIDIMIENSRENMLRKSKTEEIIQMVEDHLKPF